MLIHLQYPVPTLNFDIMRDILLIEIRISYTIYRVPDGLTGEVLEAGPFGWSSLMSTTGPDWIK